MAASLPSVKFMLFQITAHKYRETFFVPLHGIYCYMFFFVWISFERFACVLPEPVPAPVFQFRSVFSGTVRMDAHSYDGYQSGRR